MRTLSLASSPTPRARQKQWGKDSMCKSQNSVSGWSRYSPWAKCGRNYPGECLARQKGFFGYGKSSHGIKDCPYARQENRDVRPQTQATSTLAPIGRAALPQGASSSTGGGQC